MAVIGLLGGSFNPAHAGHLHISRTALRRLRLDAVWWLVSPQNPLKSRDDMAAYEARFSSALAMARYERRIRVSHFETAHDVRYTRDTIARLQRLYPQHRFVWLMGADNLAQFHRWRGWADIARRVPIAVFDRAPFSHHALRGRMATRYRQARVMRGIVGLARQSTPAWAYLPIRRHPASSTAIRKRLGNFAHWRHNGG